MCCGMADLNSSQTTVLFEKFAKHWQETLGGQLILLSPDGEILAKNVNGRPPLNYTDLLAQISPHQPTFLTQARQTLLAAPLFRDNRTLGYLLATDVKEQDVALLTWSADTIMDYLVDEEALQDMTDELIGAWNQLELIYRVTQNLNFTTDLMAVLQSIIEEIRKVVDTEDGFILLYHANAITCVTCTQTAEARLIHRNTLLNNLIRVDHVVLCENSLSCQEIWPQAPADIETMLATDLPVEEEVKAAIGLINKIDKKFTAGDTKLLAAVAQQVGAIVKNFLLHQNLIIEERLSRELEIAAEIQKSLLPTRVPQIGGLAIAVVTVPASEVGGDFYDFITVGDHRLTLVMGDVAGKGIPAAMLTSVTRTMLRVEAIRGEPPYSIIQQANNVLHQDLSRADSFVTVVVATIDTLEGTLSYASAGHMPTLLWRAQTGVIEQLKATSPPIGIFGYIGKPAQQVVLEPGDTIIFYTDGITEARSPNGELFGIDRLLQLIEVNAHQSPDTLQQLIQSELTNFGGNSLTGDDATLLIAKMLPQTQLTTSRSPSTIVKTVDFSYPADIQHLNNISKEIINTCRQLPALASVSSADDFIYLIELAISEICTNIIKHAYYASEGNITGSITLLNNGVQLDFYDQGASFDPTSIPRPSTDPYKLVEGGYGLHIVRQIMDVVSYEQTPGQGNHWHLIKFLPRS